MRVIKSKGEHVTLFGVVTVAFSTNNWDTQTPVYMFKEGQKPCLPVATVAKKDIKLLEGCSLHLFSALKPQIREGD